MIKHLYIENFILIDKLSLDFENGFSAFIGETGAGKSILIDAISLLCADRGSSSYISKGKDKAIIEGTFDLSNDKHALNVLQDAGFNVEDDVTFTRELSLNGKSVARIDHRIVSLSLLKDVLKDEIDIHGQRDNAYLLNVNEHIHLLDEYLNVSELKASVSNLYQIFKSLCDEKEKALQETYNENDLEYFEYQLKEINDANLQIGEDEELEQKEKLFHTLKNSYSKFNEIIFLYDSIDGEFYELNKKIQSIDENSELDSIKEHINDSYYNLSDSISSLKNFYSNIDISEEEINEVEERLFVIQKLKHKYGHSIQDILNKKEELEKQISMYANRTEFLNNLDHKMDEAYKNFLVQAKKLSEIRKKGKDKLDKEIISHLKDLSLPNAKFFTQIKEAKANINGIDQVEFLISMNKGEDLKPLSKTASGGELSRLMLGLKVIFTKLQGIQTIIFDEIDTGVSGAVASAIGKKMLVLSNDCQVFTVTHLAPVAAYANNHYLVKKKTLQDSTITSVMKLNRKETIEQLALISSGTVSDLSVHAAEELLDRSKI